MLEVEMFPFCMMPSSRIGTENPRFPKGRKAVFRLSFEHTPKELNRAGLNSAPMSTFLPGGFCLTESANLVNDPEFELSNWIDSAITGGT